MVVHPLSVGVEMEIAQPAYRDPGPGGKLFQEEASPEQGRFAEIVALDPMCVPHKCYFRKGGCVSAVCDRFSRKVLPGAYFKYIGTKGKVNLFP